MAQPQPQSRAPQHSCIPRPRLLIEQPLPLITALRRSATDEMVTTVLPPFLHSSRKHSVMSMTPMASTSMMSRICLLVEKLQGAEEASVGAIVQHVNSAVHRLDGYV